jgi:hypothetical protein
VNSAIEKESEINPDTKDTLAASASQGYCWEATELLSVIIEGLLDKQDLRCVAVDWIHLAHDGGQW